MSNTNTATNTFTNTMSTKLAAMSFAVFMTVAVNGGVLAAMGYDAETSDTPVASATQVTLPTVTIVGRRA